MPDYRIRRATLDDLDALVHHRVAMFTDMGEAIDAVALGAAFRAWLRAAMPSGDYQAWVCETAAGDIVAGAGIWLLRWPPGPWMPAGGRLAFVYNVYTEPAHRKRGLARSLMDDHPRVVRRRGRGRTGSQRRRRRTAPVRHHGLRRGVQPHDVQDAVMPTCPGLAKPPAFR